MRDVTALAAALFFVGASFGAIAVASGHAIWVPVVMSLLVFAGGSQFLAIGVVAAGGSAVAAVIGALLLNLRMLPFGLMLGSLLGKRRLLGSHLLIDESVAFSMARKDDPTGSKQAYWLSGGALFVSWNIGTVAGAVASTFVGDTDAFGIDAAFPAALLALILPSLRDRDTRTAALAGTAIAILATPWLPPGIPVLIALLGVLLPVPRKTSKVRSAA